MRTRAMRTSGLLLWLAAGLSTLGILFSAHGSARADWEWDARGGVILKLDDYRSETDLNTGVGLGFLELGGLGPSLGGIEFGLNWFGLAEIWERRTGDFKRCCVDTRDFREAFVRWQPSDAASGVQAGRFRIRMPGLDGHSHLGIEAVWEQSPALVVRAAMIDRWIDNSLTILNFRGVSGWRDVGDIAPGAGDQFWLASVRSEFGPQGFIEAFAGYQSKIMLLHGLEYGWSFAQSEARSWGLDGIVAVYGNEWPRTPETADYRDVLSWRIHLRRHVAPWTLGIGTFGVSDDPGDLGAGIFDWFTPMTVDAIIPFDGMTLAA